MNREVEQPNVSVPCDSKAKGTPEGLDAEVPNIKMVATDPETGDVTEAETALITMVGEEGVRVALLNADNESLGAMRCGTFSIGYVEEVNGTGAQEVQEFLPTRHELLQLVKYWARVDVDIESLLSG